MQSFKPCVSTTAEPPALDLMDVENSEFANRVVSGCGRFESFDYNGYHFEVDWNEIDPPGGSDDEEGIPHEQVMEEMRVLCEQLKTHR